jgi:hypothetical protein
VHQELNGLKSRHGVDADCECQEKRILMIRLDLDSVRFFDPEPFLRNSRDRLAVLFNFVLIDVAVRVHIGAALGFDLELISKTEWRWRPVSRQVCKLV